MPSGPGQFLVAAGAFMAVIGFILLIAVPKQDWTWYMWFLLVLGIFFLVGGAYLWNQSLFANSNIIYEAGDGIIKVPQQGNVIATPLKI